MEQLLRRWKLSRLTEVLKIENEKVDCLHRPCSRLVHHGKIESVRKHSEVIEQFASFSLLKLLFFVRNRHCWPRKAFPPQMTPKGEKKLRKRPFFGTADRHEKFYGRSPGALSVFQVFPLTFQ